MFRYHHLLIMDPPLPPLLRLVYLSQYLHFLVYLRNKGKLAQFDVIYALETHFPVTTAPKIQKFSRLRRARGQFLFQNTIGNAIFSRLRRAREAFPLQNTIRNHIFSAPAAG